MTHELYRSETAIGALSAQSLAWDSWAFDSLTALGMSAIRNPLGSKLLHFINTPSGPRAMEICLMLSTRLLRDGHQGNMQDLTFQAFEYWNSRHCLKCNGNGVLDFQQTPCERCGGTGDRPVPTEYNETVKAAVSMLIEAENWMEGQLRARMAPCYVPEHVYHVAEQKEGVCDE